MPNRPGNEDRTIAGGGGIHDRTNQRDNPNDVTRNNGQGSSTRTRSNRGFASMDRGKQREIASKGGKAAHAKGTAHEFDSGEAREAGRKGGVAVSRNREHMAAIGRRGGEARGQARGRNAGQANTAGTGSSLEGSFQNTRAGTPGSERQVAIDNQHEGVSDTLGNRGGNSSLGGERRPQGGNDVNARNDRNETFGNR